MYRRTAIATIGTVTLSSFTGCLGESGEIEHTGTSDPQSHRSPVYGDIVLRTIDLNVEVPSERTATIELDLTRTAIARLSITEVAGSGTLLLIPDSEYEKYEQGETPDGIGIGVDGESTYKDGFTIRKTKHILIAENLGQRETNTEGTFEGEVTITERLPTGQQFNYPAID